jgi:D-sedoheptulose 7-phosphate isomerase
VAFDSLSAPAQSVWHEALRDSPELDAWAPDLARAFGLLAGSLRGGGQILVCGNGGSAADSEHIAGELAKPCALDRPLPEEVRRALLDAGDDGYLGDTLRGGLPVLPLVSQAALITAIANDQGGDLIFAQQVVAYGRPGDCLWALSTSGSSANVLHALRTSRARGMRTLGFCGPTPGAMASVCDVVVALPGPSVPQVQHAHQVAYHAMCLALEAEWFAS